MNAIELQEEVARLLRQNARLLALTSPEKNIWDVSIDRYDTQPKVVTATLRRNRHYYIKKSEGVITVYTPIGGEMPEFYSLQQAMGYCERREALL